MAHNPVWYRVEATDPFTECLFWSEVSNIAKAKRSARRLSRTCITAYVVIMRGTEAVGHIAFGEGRQSEILGEVA